MRTKKSLIAILVIAALSVVIVLGQTVAPTLLDFPSGTLIIDTINLGGVSRDTWPAGGGAGVTHDQDLNTTDDVTFASVDTGQGANELYDMDQNVLTTSNPTFDELTASGALTDWIELNGANRSTWPVSGSGNALAKYPFAYLVFTNSTGAYAINGTTGLIDSQGVDSDTIANYALANMPKRRLGISNSTSWQEKVVLVGGFPIDNTLIIYQFTCLDARQAAMFLEDGSNCDMVRNYHYATGPDNYISIWGGIWNANRAGNDYSTVFNIQGVSGRNCLNLEFGGKIRMLGAENETVHLKYHNRVSQWGSMEISNGDDTGFWFQAVSDSWFSGELTCSSTTGSALVLLWCGSNKFNMAYWGGDSANSYHNAQVVLQEAYDNQINTWLFDYVRGHALLFEGSETEHNLITSVRISTQMLASDTYDAVRFDDDAGNNTIMTLHVIEKRDPPAGAHTWKYVANEADVDCDFNQILSGKAEQYQTKFNVQGANSSFNALG